MEQKFDVVQFFESGSCEVILEMATTKECLEKALSVVISEEANKGTIRRVILTDSDGKTRWEWQYDKGIIFPLYCDKCSEIGVTAGIPCRACKTITSPKAWNYYSAPNNAN